MFLIYLQITLNEFEMTNKISISHHAKSGHIERWNYSSSPPKWLVKYLFANPKYCPSQRAISVSYPWVIKAVRDNMQCYNDNLSAFCKRYCLPAFNPGSYDRGVPIPRYCCLSDSLSARVGCITCSSVSAQIKRNMCYTKRLDLKMSW